MSFLNLPLVIVRLVLEQLEDHDLHNFGLTSVVCRRISEPLQFRELTLHDRNRTPKNVKMVSLFCDRLCNPEDELRQHVRHLKIGPFHFDRFCPSDQVLAEILNNLHDLRDLTWNVRPPMKDAVFAALSVKWPEAKVHVLNLERNCHLSRGVDYILMDTRLISSTQLYSLDYVVYSNHYRPKRSEHAALKSCLLHATSLKRLRLIVVGSYSSQESWSAHPSLDFQQGDVFPALEELSLSIQDWHLTREQCRQWAAGMDWSKLRNLNLGPECPELFLVLSALTGKVPKLEEVSFGSWSTSTNSSVPAREHEYRSIVEGFLDGIEGLVRVVVIGWHLGGFLRIRDSLWETHGDSLRKLHGIVSLDGDGEWDLQSVRTMVEKCPLLEDLAIKVAMEMDDKGYACAWPDTTVDQLVKLTHLRHLQIVVPLLVQSYATEFLAAETPGTVTLMGEAAQNRAVDLFTRLRSIQHSWIKTVKVKFQLRTRTGDWGFTMKRRDGSNLGYLIEGPGKLTVVDGPFDPFG